MTSLRSRFLLCCQWICLRQGKVDPEDKDEVASASESLLTDIYDNTHNNLETAKVGPAIAARVNSLSKAVANLEERSHQEKKEGKTCRSEVEALRSDNTIISQMIGSVPTSFQGLGSSVYGVVEIVVLRLDAALVELKKESVHVQQLRQDDSKQAADVIDFVTNQVAPTLNAITGREKSNKAKLVE
jgi:hypothetical protein